MRRWPCNSTAQLDLGPIAPSSHRFKFSRFANRFASGFANRKRQEKKVMKESQDETAHV
jgi:hypothetical protein